jgi:tape measure domain-containing protein
MAIISNIGLKLTAEGGEQVQRELRLVDNSADKTAKSTDVLGDAFGRLRGLFLGFSAAVLAREFVQTADAMTAVNARLKLATTSTEEYARAQQDVYRISQAQGSSLRETADLYARLADPIRKLGGSSKEVAAITESLAASLRISGTTGAAAAGAITQFAQAMASGALRGDEFNSVNEAAPRLMQALEASLGKTRGELRGMAEDGKLTADVVGNALIGQLSALQAESATLPETVGVAFQKLQNELGLFVAGANDATGATSGLAQLISGAAMLVREFSGALTTSSASTRDLTSQSNLLVLTLASLGRVMETVVVLGANVGYVFSTIAKQVEVTARARDLFRQGDWEGGMAVWRSWSAEADAARARIDAFSDAVVGSTDRVLAQREALKAGTVTASENVAEMSRLARQAGLTSDALKSGAVSAKEQAAQQKAAAKAAGEQADAEARLLKAFSAKNSVTESAVALVDKQLSSGTKLLELGQREIDAIDAAATARDKAFDGYRQYYQSRVDGEALVVDAAEESAQRITKLNDQIGQSLANALMDGGKSAWEYIVGLFRSQVLSPVIQAVISPITGGLSSAISGAIGSFGGVQGAASGGSGLLGSASSLLSAGGALGGLGVFGASVGAGFSGLLSGGLGAALSGSASLLGAGNLAAGLGLGLGALGPIALAVGVLGPKLFGRKLKDFGIEGQLSTEGIDGNAYRYYKGGLFRSNKTKRSELDPGIDSAFDAGLAAATATVQSYVSTLGLPVQALAGYSEQIKLSFKGLSEDEIRQLISDTVADFQANLASVYSQAVSEYARAGETALQTLQRLSALEQLSAALNDYGGAFSRIATLSIDARESLVSLAGGIETLLGKTQEFVRLYYSEQEQAALAARQVSARLSDAGVNVAGLSSTAEYRALLEGQDLNSEQGRVQFAALLDSAGAFAQLAQFLQANGGTLSSLAQSAPANEVLQTLFDAQAQTQEPLQIGLDNVSATVAQGSGEVVGAIDRMRQELSEQLIGLRSETGVVISNTAAAARQLSAWDDGGYVLTQSEGGA